MPPSREPSMSLLFHPKKNKKPVPHPNGSPRRNPLPGTLSRPKTSSSSPAGTPSAVKNEERDTGNTNTSKGEPEEDTFKLPEGPYQEFKVMSSALNGWKFDVMKFDSRKTVDLATWQGPVKLNRKDLRREDPEAATSTGPLKPMLGLDGQQVYGADGKPVMVDAEGKPVVEGAGTSGVGKGKGPNGAGKKKFQKKTKQVFIVPDEIRALRREERYPWVVEDATGQETWVAQLDELSKSATHGFFMPAATGDIFKFVPSHRWYRFQKKLKHDLPTDTNTVETAYQKSQKRDPTLWLRQRNGKGPSAATAATFKAEAEGRITLGGSGSLVQHATSSLGPGGRRLKAVDTGGELFGDDDEDGDYKRRRQKEFGGEGDLDENVYEEEFADDEEKMDVDDNDQEAKELEERLKREYKNANKTREGYIDESDEEDVKPVIGKQGKAMKKMLKTREGGDAYESEEEENPYASSAEEEEEEEVPPQAEGPAVIQQPQQIKPKQEPMETTIPKGTSPPIQNGVATPLSPEPPSPTSPASPTSGHSLLAKRATSPPKAPKVKTEPGSRAGSPLAGSRAGSPVAGSGSRASSPVNGHPKKRKAEDSGPSPASPPGANGNASQVPKAKKRKGTVPGGAPTPTGPLEEWMLVDWLKNTPNASTKECIQHFGPYLKDEKEKARFTALVKELASLKNGKLVLKSHYRGSAGPATPTAS